MKRYKWVVAVLLMVLLAAGCGKKENDGQTATPGQNQDSPGTRNQDADHADQGDGVGEQVDVNRSTATVYGVKDGIVTDFATVELDYQGNISDNPHEYFEELVEAVGDYLGYPIDVEEVYSGKGGITVDFDKDSAPVVYTKLEKAYDTKQSKIEYEDYDQMVIGILDSIHKTIQENNGAPADIWYTCEDKALSFPNLKEKREFSLEGAYQPSYK